MNIKEKISLSDSDKKEFLTAYKSISGKKIEILAILI